MAVNVHGDEGWGGSGFFFFQGEESREEVERVREVGEVYRRKRCVCVCVCVCVRVCVCV